MVFQVFFLICHPHQTSRRNPYQKIRPIGSTQELGIKLEQTVTWEHWGEELQTPIEGPEK
jgi:hypothetical protein